VCFSYDRNKTGPGALVHLEAVPSVLGKRSNSLTDERVNSSKSLERIVDMPTAEGIFIRHTGTGSDETRVLMAHAQSGAYQRWVTLQFLLFLLFDLSV
jgi:hypothetical protein